MAAKLLSITKENLWTNNPIFIQILGICSALAVTNNLINTSIMSAGVIFVTGFSNLTVSLLKNIIPRKVRMIIQTLIIAFYVIIVDIFLRAFLPDISRALGPYIGLIITNCIIMGRAEAFAGSHPPLISLWDGLTSGAGYMGVLMLIAFIRELLGYGTVFGFQVFPEGKLFGLWLIFPQGFQSWVIMLMPPSAFFLLGIIIWIAKTIMLRKKDKS
jgi:Na+-transporting NADH:ubiquinone oxidoreductase subunit D